MKQVKIQVARGENFTPNSLMYRYAKQTPGVTFEHGRFCTTFLRIDGKTYDYHHWSITAESGVDTVTLHLEEAKHYDRMEHPRRIAGP